MKPCESTECPSHPDKQTYDVEYYEQNGLLDLTTILCDWCIKGDIARGYDIHIIGENTDEPNRVGTKA